MRLTALIIIGAIVLVIFLINLIPVGVDLRYADDVLTVYAKADGKLIQLVPKPEKKPKKEKKSKKEKKKKAEEPEEEKPKGDKLKKLAEGGVTKEEIVSLLKVVLSAAGKFRRKLYVRTFKFWFVSSDPDPYTAVMTYNYVNDALCGLGTIADQSLRFGKCDVRTAVDFDVGVPFVEAQVAVTIRIGQIVGIGISAGIAALKIIRKRKKRIKKLAGNELAA
jgi:hypothetical protein